MNTLLRLEESSNTSLPDHFKHLVNTLHMDGFNLIESDKNISEIFNLPNDYMLCVIVTVAIECGFRLGPSTTENFDIRESKTIKFNPKWRDFSRRLYSVDLQLANINDFRYVMLLMPIQQNGAIVNFLSLKRAVVERTAVMSLLPGQWVSVFGPTLPERFRNLPTLARRVRNYLQKEKDIALNSARIPNPSLLGLHEELKKLVFEFLSAKDFVQLTGTCKLMKSYQKDEAIWRHFLKKDFDTEADDPFDMYVCRFCTTKIVAPSYPQFGEDPPTSRATSVSTLDTIM